MIIAFIRSCGDFVSSLTYLVKQSHFMIIFSFFIFVFVFSYVVWSKIDKQVFEMEKRKLERSFLNNGSILLEGLIASSNGKCNPIRYFSAEELMRATNNFDPSHIIGNCASTEKHYEGGSVRVYAGYVLYRSSLDDRPIIVKKFMGTGDEARSLAIRDIVIRTQMSNHMNVLKLLGCCLEFPVPVLVHEYAAKEALNSQGGFGADESLPWRIRLRIANELANALTYLHTALARPVIHRDLKPVCIFLDHNYVPKLGTFALSITIPPQQSHANDDVKGTCGYVDPEYWHSGSVTVKTDVYSFGVLLLIFLTGKKAVDTYQADEYHKSIVSYVKLLVQDDRLNEIVDPKILGEGGGDEQVQQLKAFLALALSCTQDIGEARPDMIDVAKELMRIEKSIFLC